MGERTAPLIQSKRTQKSKVHGQTSQTIYGLP
jgi:hypothetical protein